MSGADPTVEMASDIAVETENPVLVPWESLSLDLIPEFVILSSWLAF